MSGSRPRRSPQRMAGPLEGLIASGNVERRARLVELMRTHHDATVGDCGLDETLATIRDEMRKFADSEVMPHAHAWHRTNSYIPLDVAYADVRARRVRPHHRGGVWRPRARQGIDVRRLRGAFPRLYRGRLARHALRDRGRADHRRRHRGAEAQMAAEARLRRGAADGGVHRAQYRLRSRLAQDPGGAARATSTRSTATRPGSPIPCAPT